MIALNNLYLCERIDKKKTLSSGRLEGWMDGWMGGWMDGWMGKPG